MSDSSLSLKKADKEDFEELDSKLGRTKYTKRKKGWLREWRTQSVTDKAPNLIQPLRKVS